MKEKKIADSNYGLKLREGTTPYCPASKTVEFGEEIGLHAELIRLNISMNQFIEMGKCSYPIFRRGRMIPRCTLSILGKVVGKDVLVVLEVLPLSRCTCAVIDPSIPSPRKPNDERAGDAERSLQSRVNHCP